MNLQQLLLSVDAQGVADAHNAHYAEEDGTHAMTPRWFTDTLLPIVAAKVLKPQPGYRMVLDHWRREYQDPSENQESFDVLMMDPSGNEYSTSFVEWAEQLAWEVEDRTNLGLTREELAAHMVWELTWHGLEEDSLARGQEITESADKAKLDHERHDEDKMIGLAEPQSLPQGYHSFEDIFGRQTPEQKASTDAYIANMRTERAWKNGQPVGPNHVQ